MERGGGHPSRSVTAIQLLRRRQRFLKTVACFVTVAFLGLTLQPLALAANLPAKPNATETQPPSNEEKLSKHIETIEARLEQLEVKLDKKQDSAKEQAEIKILRPELDALDQQAIIDFDKIEQHLKDKKLPAVILNRHAEAVKTYQTEMATLKANLDDVDKAKDDTERMTKAQKAKEHLKAKQRKKTHTPVDPNNLPFRVPDAKKTRKPAETKEDFRKLGFIPEERIQLASTTLLPGMLNTAAALALPSPADLQPTEDVQITDEIKTLAESLNHNPVKIYNWVYNNIYFVPTYGSIQGSQMCLETKQCNAFDTASLLIALLRASGISSHYVYGTIQIPADKVMNWVGGVTAPQAAQDLLGQGGIPNTALVTGGKVTHIRLEHVWVEAFVDFYPSRGAIHKQGDTWVPIDGAFKQYQFTAGMDIKTNVPFDAQVFTSQITATAQINEQEGWATGIDQNYAQTALLNYQDQVRAYVESIKPGISPGDVIGMHRIISRSHSVLATSLPYGTVTVGNRYPAIPDNLRHRFQFNLYTDALDRALDSPVLSFDRSLPSITGKKITLSFVPLTQTDADLIRSYLPALHADGSPIQMSELPPNLPGYLIRLAAELRIDGSTIARGGSFTMGQELISSLGLFSPGKGWSFADDNRPVAGDYQAIGLNPGRISLSQAQTIQNKITAIKSSIDAGQIGGLNPENTSGDLLHGVLVGYFAAVDRQVDLHSQAAGMVHYRLPSFGTFTAIAKTTYSFGIPRLVSFPGVVMDIDHLELSVWHKNNEAGAFSKVIREIGLASSAYEHLVPEKLLTNAENPAEGVSAVKAITTAATEGQRIYTITRANLQVVMPQLSITPEIRAEIESAVNAGNEVTVSQSNVTIGGWTGVGYIIIDPDTGSGAYKISGGTNGSEMSLCNSIVLAIQIVLITVLLIALITILAGGLPALVATAAAAVEVITAATAYVVAAVAGLPAAIRAVVAASLMTFVSSQVIAGDVIGEICQLETPFTDVCLYRCQSDLKSFETPRPREAGPCGRLLPCKGAEKRPSGL